MAEPLVEPGRALPALRAGDADHGPAARRARLEADLIGSLGLLFESAAEALELDGAALGQGFRRPAARGARLSPGAFGFYHQLTLAMEAGDGELVRDLLGAASQGSPWSTAPGIAIEPTVWRRLAWWRFVEVDGTAPGGPATPISRDRHDAEAAVVRGALADLEARSPPLFGELSVMVSDLALCEGASFNGMTERRAFGLVFLNVPRAHHHPGTYYLEHLVHAGALSSWFCIQAAGVAWDTPNSAAVVSPWDGREVSVGRLVFEAFWLARAVNVFRAASGPPELEDKCAVLEGGLSDVVQTLTDTAERSLSDAGRRVVAACARAR